MDWFIAECVKYDRFHYLTAHLWSYSQKRIGKFLSGHKNDLLCISKCY